MNRLGVIAGGGPLPLMLAEHCQANGREVFVAGVSGAAAPEISSFPHQWVELGRIGDLLRILREQNCGEIVFIGPVKRPDIRHLRLDFAGWRFLPRFLLAARGGDDRLLRTLIAWFEEKGFRVRGAHEFLADLCGPAGILGKVQPGAQDLADIRVGVQAARRHGARDRGQAVVVRGDEVLEQEAEDGTDAMLRRCVARRKLSDQSGRAGVLVKLLKPGQETRIDLPTLGLTSVRLAAEAGLAGIAFEAGVTLLVDAPAMITEADALGLFLSGLPLTGHEA